MSSIPSRDKPLWARGTARLMGFRTAEADRRIGDALAWLEARLALIAEKTEGRCCRALIAGAAPGVRPQITALTLARALADSSARVILVDASQGAGALSGPLELPRSPGLAELCQQKATFEDVIHRDPLSGLHYLAPGKPRSLGGEWGEGGVLDKICRALDETYALTLFCAEHDEATFLAATLRRPFAAAVMVRERARPQRGAAQVAAPADFAAFGFPLHWLDQQS
jgi:hypothetical protein